MILLFLSLQVGLNLSNYTSSKTLNKSVRTGFNRGLLAKHF